jgi:hypothetical protein
VTADGTRLSMAPVRLSNGVAERADADVFFADGAGLAGAVDAGSVDAGGGHVCVGQATTGLSWTLLLGAPTRRTMITASAIISIVGKITAKIWSFRLG